MERSLPSSHKIGIARPQQHPPQNNHHHTPTSSENPLICFHYLTRQLYEMTGSDIISAPDDSKNGSRKEDVEPASIPFVAGGKLTPVPSHSSHRPHQDSTCTPKRRRKENGRGSSIRFSPDKKTQWRETIFRSGSLLDQQTHQSAEDEDDEEKSLLFGAGIRIPNSRGCEYRYVDELSYSDSDVTNSPVAVSKEIGKELTGEHRDEDMDSSFASYPSKEDSKRLFSRNSSLEALNSSHGNHRRSKKAKPRRLFDVGEPTTRSSIVGGVVMVEKAPAYKRLSSSLCNSPKRFGRQVSVCSELTMEGLVSETSVSSEQKSDGDSDEGESKKSSWSDDDEADDSSRGSTLSATSADSEVWRAFLAEESYSHSSASQDQRIRRHRHPQHVQRHKVGERNRRRTSSSRHHYISNRRPQAEEATEEDSSLRWMWLSEDNYNNIENNLRQPTRRRRPSGQVQKRRKGTHRRSNRCPDNEPRWQLESSSSPTKNSNHHYGASKSTGFLFPLQQLTDTFQGNSPGQKAKAITASAKNGQEDMEENSEEETSILLDLTEDLKEIAIIAGKSSENLVSNILNHLWEES